MTLSIAIDAGGTAVRAVAIAGNTPISVAFGGRGNPVSAGREIAGANVLGTVVTALETAGALPGDVRATTICGAGGSFFSAGDWLEHRFQEAGLPGRVHVRSDLMATFCSGTGALDGYAMVSGTGAAAVRVHDGVLVSVADGMGFLLGDGGSGFWFGQQVARAVIASLDGRGAPTALTDALIDHLGVERADGVYGHEGRTLTTTRVMDTLLSWPAIELATLAPLAFAAEGDAVAADIVARGILELERSLAAVVRPDNPGPLVFSGSVLTKQTRIAEAMAAVLNRSGIPADIRIVADGLVGATVLALREAGEKVDEAEHTRLVRQVGELVAAHA